MGVPLPLPVERYQPLLELGRGGMAAVYLCVTRGPGGFQKLHVLKRLRREVVADAPEMLTMFLEEARLAARINHPNVVQTHEVGDDGAHHFIAMEYLDGQSLRAIVREGGDKFPLALHLRVLCGVLAGLHAAHELRDFDGKPLSVVHRDLSPHNVIVTYAGVTKLIDFGIAKAVDSQCETRSGVLKGKYPYMAPEQFVEGGKTLDRRADIYAAGVMLWQALTGQVLWPRGTDEMEVMRRVMNGDIPRPSSKRADVRSDLEAVCMKALSVERSERFATAAQMQTAIEGCLSAFEPRPTDEDVGAFVRELFSETRRALNQVVETRIRDIASSSYSVPHVLSLVPTASPSSSSFSHADQVMTKSTIGAATKNERPRGKRTRRGLAFAGAAAAVAAIGLAALVHGPGASRDAAPSAIVHASPAPPSTAAASAPAPLQETASTAIAAAPTAAAAELDAGSAKPTAGRAADAVRVTARAATPKPAVTATAKAAPAVAAPDATSKRRPKVDESDPWSQ